MNFNKKIVLCLPLLVTTPLVSAETTVEHDDLFAEEEIPLVLSATRLRQSQQETPASVTIIDREQIKASGAKNIVETLRLVPGLGIFYSNASTPEVSIHSLLSEFSRRMQVLVDGQSVFKPGLSRVLWSNLPINIDEVERIEVIRGPNTSSYGSNAFLGVINIITRNPSDQQSNSASILAGNNGIGEAFVKFANTDKQLSYQVSAGYAQHDGIDGIYRGQRRIDGYKRHYLRADLNYILDLKNQWRVTLGHSEVDQDVDLLDEFQVEPSHPQNTKDTSLNLSWQHTFNDHHSLTIQGSFSENKIREMWRSCPPAFLVTQELGDLYNLDPDYAIALVDALTEGSTLPTPTSSEVAQAVQPVLIRASQLGLNQVCGNANQNFDETKWELELVDQYKVNEDLRLVSGLGLRKDKILGNSLFSGEPEKDTWYAFGNFEWRLAPQWLFNGGVLYEHDEDVNSAVSPRLALNYLPSSHSAIRLVAAKGIRTPDFYEQNGSRNYQLDDLDFSINGTDTFATFFVTPESQGNLKEEVIHSYELGWYYNNSNVSFDVKLFREEIRDAIDGVLSLENYNPQNTHDFNNTGVDLQLEYRFSESDKIWFNASVMDHDLIRGRFINKQMIEKTAAVMYQHTLNESSDISLAFYNQTLENSRSFERVDLRYGISTQISHVATEIDFVLQHRLSDAPFFSSRNVIDNQTTAFLRARFNF